MNTKHETLVFERHFEAAPAKLFAAYIDPKVREAWATPSPTAEVKIDQSDVRTGGKEIGRCGAKGDLRWTTKTTYHLVILNQHISFTEELWEGDRLLTVALITFDIQAKRDGVLLTLTDQIMSLVGNDGLAGHREGYDKALENLGKIITAT